MCGIFGFYLNRELTIDDINFGREATSKLIHRGPDASGEWYSHEKGIYLGHRRLAIIDIGDSSSQPMKIDRNVIVYNGELYNYIEIKDRLKDKNNFYSNGDTEVVLRSWLEHGPNCLNDFDGMFAFAVFNGKSLTLATDHFGEKPLYYYRNNDGVYFSSEPQILINHLKIKFCPSELETVSFLTTGFIQYPQTGYKSLFLLPPGSYARIEHNQINKVKYWNVLTHTQLKNKKKYIEKNDIKSIKDILLTSITRRLRSDVPVGLFLSGGIDSALIAALISKELNQNIRAYTVSFPDGYDEGPIAKKIADYLNIEHKIINSLEDRSWKKSPLALRELFGIPNDNSASLFIYQMSLLLTNEDIRVALSGIGGDELFYGYNKYLYSYKYRYLYRYLTPLINNNIYSSVGNILNFRKMKNMARMLRGSQGEQFLSLKNSFIPIISKLPNFKKFSDIILSQNSHIDLVHKIRNFDLQNTLPGSYIPAVDRGSMRASLEVRAPFLSKALLEKLSEFHPSALIDKGQKHILKEILSDYLPEDILKMKKQGFIFPVERYLTSQPTTSTPVVPDLNEEIRNEIWSNKDKVEYRSLAYRMKILSEFHKDNLREQT